MALNALITVVNENRAVIHLVLHLLIPLLLAWLYTRSNQTHTAIKVRGEAIGVVGIFALLMVTMLVDMDHLIADPIYAPNRCSILFHPLHTLAPMVLYIVMCFWPTISKAVNRAVLNRDRIIACLGVGLCIHMILDAVDCLWMKACI